MSEENEVLEEKTNEEKREVERQGGRDWNLLIPDLDPKLILFISVIRCYVAWLLQNIRLPCTLLRVKS